MGWFKFTLTYHPGSKNTKPDTLSHQFTPDHSGQGDVLILGTAAWQVVEKVRQALSYARDPGGAPPNSLFMSESVWSGVLQWGHRSWLACHLGLHLTLHLLWQRFWWPSMVQDTQAFIAACAVCAQGTSRHQPPAGLLTDAANPMAPVYLPWYRSTSLGWPHNYSDGRGPIFKGSPLRAPAQAPLGREDRGSPGAAYLPHSGLPEGYCV